MGLSTSGQATRSGLDTSLGHVSATIAPHTPPAWLHAPVCNTPPPIRFDLHLPGARGAGAAGAALACGARGRP